MVRRFLHARAGRLDWCGEFDLKFASGNRGIPAGNPIANVFVILVGAVVIGVSVVLGFVAFIVLGSIVAMLAATIGLRVWWFNRKLRSKPSTTSAKEPVPGGVIEGEFQVIEDDRDDRSDI